MNPLKNVTNQLRSQLIYKCLNLLMTSLIYDIFNNYYFHNIQSEIYFIVVLPLPVLLLQSFHSLVDLLLFYWTATIFLVSLIII